MFLTDILNRYAGSQKGQPDTVVHFDQVTQVASTENVGTALASMFRSDVTAPFSELVGTLFEQSNGEQRAGVLNHLAQALGPAAATAGGGILGKLMGSSAGGTAPASITPEQASQISGGDVAQLAAHAERENPSVVDRVGSFYAQHPTLVKTLGATALAVALGHMRKPA